MTAYITGGTRGLKIGFNVTAVTRNVFSEEKETETRGQVICRRGGGAMKARNGGLLG